MTPDQDLSARLLPCPFCGGEAEIWRAHMERTAWICCMGKCSVLVSREYKTDAEAIAAWNTRAPTDHERAVQAAVAKAVEASGYNPRYIAYAHDQGRSAHEQMEIDKAGPGAPMAQFVAWLDRSLAMFRAVSPQSFAASGLKDAASFDDWLERYGAPISDDIRGLLDRAAVMSTMLRMGDKISFGSDADLIDELAAAIRSRGVAG